MAKRKKDKLSPEARAYFKREHEDSHSVVAVEVVGPMSLHLTFDDGKEATIDFEPALRLIFTGPMYEPFFAPDFFAQAKPDENGILTWPNGMDFMPAYLYDWPHYVGETLAELAAAQGNAVQ